LGYGVDVEPSGPIITVDNSDPLAGGTAVIQNLDPDVSYTFGVFGVNQAGRGKVTTVTKKFPYNVAYGGTITEVDDYNSTGQKWRVHTFTTNGQFTVTSAIRPFRVFVIGGGGGNGASYRNEHSNGGGAGLVAQDDNALLPIETLPVVVGKGGRGSGNYPDGGSGRTAAAAGTDSTFNGMTGKRGGRGGGYEIGATLNGGPDGGNIGGGALANGSRSSRTAITSDITGTPVDYGLGGATGSGTPSGYGNGGGAITNPGKAGVVVVAYQIG